MDWRISDEALAELAQIAESTRARGWTLNIHERAYLDLRDARELLQGIDLPTGPTMAEVNAARNKQFSVVDTYKREAEL